MPDRRRKIVLTVMGLLLAGALAFGIWKRWVATTPRSALSPQQTGRNLLTERSKDFQQKYYGPVIATYLRMIEKEPGGVDLKVKLAQVYMVSQQYPEAKELLQEVLEADPKHPLALELIQKIP